MDTYFLTIMGFGILNVDKNYEEVIKGSKKIAIRKNNG